ncbi:hypothetical protein GCM10009840_29570 [Pseudolysinimonas kribbensis]|uniref:DnaJ family domain-containing protein n=1 Tax=Pseudolysinimonas kribbensis TaxID=433641 RepID=UPI0031DA76B5
MASPGRPEEPEPIDHEGAAARESMNRRAHFVEISIQQAMRRREFDDLPGAGKPLRMRHTHDPDWWIRSKIERERLSGLGPPALTLRTEDAQLDERLDALASESAVREHLDDFNRRVVEARRQLQGGPPVITPTRDLDAEVQRWAARRTTRLREASERREREAAEEAESRRARGWRRWLGVR